MLISKTIANLVNGVSQQPPSIRNPTQCETQENILSDVTYGLVHRPHSVFLKELWELSPSDAYNAFVHTINRGDEEQYKVVIANGDLKVFDLEGNEKTVSFPDGKGYLVSASPRTDFQCLVIGTDTYVLNRTKVITQTAGDSDNPYRTGGSIVFIKQGDYSTDYSITVSTTESAGPTTYGPVQVTKTTSATDPDDIKTSEIATDLKTALDAASGSLGGGLDVERVGSVLFLYPQQPTIGFPWSIEVATEDSKGNNNHRLIRSQIQKFADLPTTAPSNFSVQVVGDTASGFDDYYVKFVTDDPYADFSNGSWVEFSPDPMRPWRQVMPHRLVNNGDGTFTFEELEWDQRDAGDSFTNPAPPFIGQQIESMFTFGNRLGFLYGGKVSLSEVGIFTNFYLTTVVTFLDSDPIHIEEIGGFDKWLYAVPLAEKIILFSKRGQAIISGDGLLTPKTASLKGATRYPVSETCEPITIGDNVYFTAPNGDFSRTYEYFIQGDVESFKAAEVSSHAPQYVPVTVDHLTGDDAAKMLVASNRTNTLYVYKYFWVGDQKVQSSWSKWIFDPKQIVIDCTLADNVLYVVSYDEDLGDLLFSQIDLDITKIDSGNDELTRTHLDLRIDGTDLSTTLDGTQRSFVLPFSLSSDAQARLRVYRKEDQLGDPRVSWGEEVPILEWDGDDTFIIDDPDDEIGENVWIGFPYTSTYTFSEIHYREERNGVQVPIEVGKLSIRKMDILFTESLYFRVEVTPHNRDTKTYTMTPFILGDPRPLNEIAGRSGKISVPVNSSNTGVTISVINDSVVPHRIQSAEWTGQYTILSRRV